MTQQDDYLVDAILAHKDLAEVKEVLALAEDTIRIALKTAGYSDVESMSQFERASALLNMAQELAALTTVRVSVGWANGRGYNGKVYKEITA
jgi:hypothetical protein